MCTRHPPPRAGERIYGACSDELPTWAMRPSSYNRKPGCNCSRRPCGGRWWGRAAFACAPRASPPPQAPCAYNPVHRRSQPKGPAQSLRPPRTPQRAPTQRRNRMFFQHMHEASKEQALRPRSHHAAATNPQHGRAPSRSNQGGSHAKRASAQPLFGASALRRRAAAAHQAQPARRRRQRRAARRGASRAPGQARRLTRTRAAPLAPAPARGRCRTWRTRACTCPPRPRPPPWCALGRGWRRRS